GTHVPRGRRARDRPADARGHPRNQGEPGGPRERTRVPGRGPMSADAKPRVPLVGPGGTISSIGRDSLDLWEYMDTGLKAEPDELLVRFPEAAEAAEIVSVRFRAVSSAAIGPREWLP